MPKNKNKSKGVVAHPLSGRDGVSTNIVGTFLCFDATNYVHYLKDTDLSEEQKAELLAAVWSIIVSFVDLGIGICPVQEVLNKSSNKETPLEAGFPDVLRSRKVVANSHQKKLRSVPKCEL